VWQKRAKGLTDPMFYRHVYIATGAQRRNDGIGKTEGVLVDPVETGRRSGTTADMCGLSGSKSQIVGSAEQL